MPGGLNGANFEILDSQITFLNILRANRSEFRLEQFIAASTAL